jgi:NAD(P)H-dependent FMN reductase
MKSKLYIPVLQGTTREGRNSIHVAKFLTTIGNSYESVTSELVDPRDFSFPGDGNEDHAKDPKYSAIVQRADAYCIVVPEYNHAPPGSLKRMLDSELKAYNHKPVAFAGVSAGPWGGIRAIQSIVPMVRELGMVATAVDVQFPNVTKLFTEEGTLMDEAYKRRSRRTFDELIWMATVLKWGRENLK